MIFPKLFNHGNLKSLKVDNGKLVMEGTYGKEEFEGGGGGLPEGGYDGQVIMKDQGEAKWLWPLPPGDANTFLKKTSEGNTYAFRAIKEVPAEGTTGQVLTKTSDGYGWADAPSGGKPEVSILLHVPNSFYSAGKRNIDSGISATISTSGDIKDYIASNTIAETYLSKSLSCRVVADYNDTSNYFIFDGSILITGDLTEPAFLQFHGTGDYNTIFSGNFEDRKSYTLGLQGFVTVPAEGPIVLNNVSLTSLKMSETTIAYVAPTT